VLVVASAAFPYVIYLFTLIAYWMRRRQLAASPTSFQLGRWAGPVLVAALIWDVIVLVCLMTPSDFHKGGLAHHRRSRARGRLVRGRATQSGQVRRGRSEVVECRRAGDERD
jgi:hypothetical protein